MSRRTSRCVLLLSLLFTALSCLRASAGIVEYHPTIDEKQVNFTGRPRLLVPRSKFHLEALVQGSSASRGVGEPRYSHTKSCPQGEKAQLAGVIT